MRHGVPGKLSSTFPLQRGWGHARVTYLFVYTTNPFSGSHLISTIRGPGLVHVHRTLPDLP
jgi:hypothetical protein